MMQPATLLLTAFLAVAASAATAADYTVGSLTISDPWSPTPPKGASVAAGYMKITNNGSAPDRLTGGASDVARSVQVHEMSMDNGVMKMRELKGGLEIKPGESVELKPGSFHVMFVGLKKHPTVGDHVAASLTFEKAGTVNVTFDVRPMGGAPAHHDMPGMKM